MAETKNDIAWTKLFQEYNILHEIKKEGFFRIDSSQINIHREARLMTKFDHSSQLPRIFSDEKLSILPISRGSYIIAPMETFHKFETNSSVEIKECSIPAYIESLDYNNITSEAMALSCAYASGIIQDFIGDQEILPTVNGRMSSEVFSFVVKNSVQDGNISIEVENSQIEIDGGYEGEQCLSLIEAKNTLSSDFLIRQLYYPFRLWERLVNKKVRSLFLTYTNGIYHFKEYDFKEIMNYNSITLVKEQKYRISTEGDEEINIQILKDLCIKTPIIEESKIPFPQADSFERIINLCEIINNKGSVLKSSLSSDFSFTESDNFDERQVDYYTNAAIYLGLVEKRQEEQEIIYYLTAEGRELFNLSWSKRQLFFVKKIIEHKAFKDTFILYLEKADVPSKDEVVEIMKQSNPNGIKSESTYKRRSSTVLSWVNWIIELGKDF
jgi:hypothetical protein